MKTGAIALRNILRNGRRSLLSGSAIAVSAAAIVFMYAFNNGMLDDLKWNIRSYDTGNVRIRNTDYGKYERIHPMHLNIPEAGGILNDLKGLTEIEGISQRISFPGRIYRNEEHWNATGMGVDFSTEPEFLDMMQDNGKKSLRGYTGELPLPGKNETLVGAGLARKMGIGIGDKITVLTQTATRGSNAMTFRVTGLVNFQYAALTETLFLVPLDRAQYFLRMDNAVMEILIKTVPGTDNGALADSLAAKWDNSGLEILPWEKIGTTLSLMSMADITYLIMSIFFMVIGSTVIINTTMMAVFERSREIGTMAALGMTPGNIVWLFFLESLVIGFLGAAGGVLAGAGLSLFFARFGINFGSAFEGMDFEMSPVIYPRLDIMTTLYVFISAFALSAAATFFPSLRAARIEPMEALRTD